MQAFCHICRMACLCLVFTARAHTATATFENYQAILDRMPFGAAPQSGIGADSNTAESRAQALSKAEQKKLAAKIKMSCVNITPDGSIAVGFTDLSLSPPRNCYLRIGAAAHGWTVLDADYDEEWATIEKEGVTITVKLGRGLIGGESENLAAQTADNQKQQQPTEPETPQEPAEPPPPMIVQYARLRAIELTGGPPMPNVSLATIPSETQAELDQERQKIRELRNRGINTRSYRERLVAKKIEAEQQRQDEDQVKLVEMEVIAREIAVEELERRALEQQAAEGEVQ